MVSLRNFKRNNDTLECDFYPEAKESNSNRCHIVIDKQTKEIVTYVAPESSICCSMHIAGGQEQTLLNTLTKILFLRLITVYGDRLRNEGKK